MYRMFRSVRASGDRCGCPLLPTRTCVSATAYRLDKIKFRRPVFLATACVVLIVWSAVASAFGPEGHRIVAEIAQTRLTPNAQAQIQILLANDLDKDGNPSGRASIAEIASWADEIKDTPVGTQEKPWHFDDIPMCGVADHNTYCADGTCASSQIAAHLAVLGDSTASVHDRNEALKWIVHLIGDIHQPLHTGTNDDFGGNTVKVKLSGIGSLPNSQKKLHGIWDTELVKQTVDDAGGEESFVAAAITDDDAQQWQQGAVADWIIESHALALNTVYANLPDGFSCPTSYNDVQTIGPAYYDVARPVLETQLRKAGIRLAEVLNEALSGATTSPTPSGSPTSTGSVNVPLDAPAPLLATGHAVPWWFVFKFNTASFPECGNDEPQTQCLFGGAVKHYSKGKSQQYVFASSDNATLQKGGGCVGATTSDPVGATFDQIYNGGFHYVVWNDQFYGDPRIPACTSCGAPWGHSKGIVAWNDAGHGVVMQVSTPSWPAAGSTGHPRATDGNTLGCVQDDDVLVSQHFFALKLNELDLRRVLLALQNASVVTNPDDPQIVNNGGPTEIQDIVRTLGVKSTNNKATLEVLSTGVTLISKPSKLQVPPWQMVSALLNGEPLRAATWWATPKIPSTSSSTKIGCWDPSLATKPGAVEIATSGQWEATTFGLAGMAGADYNHAKIGVSTSDGSETAIFGDLNQQGALSGTCGSSQNGRGGLFYIVNDKDLSQGVASLIKGSTAPQ